MILPTNITPPTPTAIIPTATPTPIQSEPTTIPTATPIVTPPSIVDAQRVKNAIQGIVNLHPELNLGVSYINIKNNTRVDVNGNEIFTAASTTKVFIACLLLSQIELGKHTLAQPLDGATVGQHLQRMINQSSNDSWTSLMKFIGYQYQVPYAKQLGITTYNLANNQISPDDMALLLDELYTGKILNAADTALLLSYMQHTNMEDLIPPAVPTGVNVYHKYGNLNDDLHDAAIIDDGKNPFVLTIYSSLAKNTITYWQRLVVFHSLVIAEENANGINTDSLISSAQTLTQPSLPQ